MNFYTSPSCPSLKETSQIQTKAQISDILWSAANHRLKSYDSVEIYGKLTYSCSAVVKACEDYSYPVEIVNKFLSWLGCDTKHATIRGSKSIEEMQGWRYLWLMFAYEVALDLEADLTINKFFGKNRQEIVIPNLQAVAPKLELPSQFKALIRNLNLGDHLRYTVVLVKRGEYVGYLAEKTSEQDFFVVDDPAKATSYPGSVAAEMANKINSALIKNPVSTFNCAVTEIFNG